MSSKDTRFKPGVSGNPKGRPEGVVSVVQKLRKRFRENPAEFEDFLDKYIKNPNNQKHIAEMLDGKPAQSIQADVKVELPQPLLNNVHSNDSNQETTEAEEED
jgi:hypothetical protein